MNDLLNHLNSKIIPFWKSLIDRKYGGFYGYVDFNLKIHKQADKSLISTARYLYTFSLWYHHLKDPTLKDFADHAYSFLTSFYKDTTHGGYVWSTDYKGNHKDVTKHLYGHAFTIYALSEYAKATLNCQAAQEALAVFELIDQKTRLGQFHYHEEFTKQWEEKDNDLLSEDGGYLPYTTNTLLHLLEAYTNLYKLTENNVVKDRLKELIEGFYHVLYHKKDQFFHMYLTDQRAPYSNGQSYGHDIETCWLIDDACTLLSIDDPDIQKMTFDVATSLYEKAMTPYGFLSEILLNRVSQEKIWWIQSEAMVGLLNHYQKTNDIKYLIATEELWLFIKKYLIDSRQKSEWFWGVDHQLKPLTYKGIAEAWKAPYHNGRALIELIKRGYHYDSSEISRTQK